MKICHRCKFENENTADYCVECGANIAGDQPTPPPAVPSPPDSPPLEFSDTNPPPEAGSLLCTSCLHPNPEGTPFCERCGAPIGAISAVGPFESLFAEGFAYRKAVEGRPKLIVLIGMWALFFTPVAAITVLLLGSFSSSPPDLNGFVILVMIFTAFVCVTVLAKVTLNYFKHAEPPGASALRDASPSSLEPAKPPPGSGE